jgi:hypothetical protein
MCPAGPFGLPTPYLNPLTPLKSLFLVGNFKVFELAIKSAQPDETSERHPGLRFRWVFFVLLALKLGV